jgi:aryl-alcohol dehydrogenase-like predicted oxidoreductase
MPGSRPRAGFRRYDRTGRATVAGAGMLTRPFGRTGWQVSALTFGAWQLGGTWGALDEGEGQDALLAAIDGGINLIDTAAAYGKGRSEEIVGRALALRPGAKVRVATKVLPLGRQQGRIESIRGQYPPAYLRAEVEASLQRLGRDHIDLLQLHLWLPDGLEELEWLPALLDLQVQGKIGWIGVSLPDIRPETGVTLARTQLVTAIQVMFNIFEQAPRARLFPEGRHTGTAFIARVPFDSGALTGTWTAATRDGWAEDDKRRQMYSPARMAETLARVDALRRDLADNCPDMATAALQFCLADPAVSTVACGMRSVAEVTANLAALAAPPMDAAVVSRLAAHHWPHDFY